MTDKSHNRRNIALGGLVLAGISYLAGVLTAPKSGKETRKDIRKAAAKAKTEAEKKLKKAHSELNVAIDELSKKAGKAKADVGKEMQKAIKQADEVKQKTREILSAIHEGEAHDHDLDKALGEVKQALKHVRKYLQK
jgi:gas vesicle protein